MKHLFFLFIAIISFTVTLQALEIKKSWQVSVSPAKEIVIMEVIQVSSYTYLKAKEGSEEKWFAVPTVDAKVGEKYYYTSGMIMKNFKSKELNRSFESIIFLEIISKNPDAGTETKTVKPHPDMDQNPHEKDNPSGSIIGKESTKGKADKKEAVKVTKADGGITIAQLFENPKSYEGKLVKIKAQVTKFSAGIMNRNWIHLQDGTESNGKFDLTATSDNLELKTGDVVTLEGKIALKKDFGHGYFYEVIMEEVSKK